MNERIHLLVSLLKDLNSKLGYPPSKIEFEEVVKQHPGLDQGLRKIGYKKLLEMCGIESATKIRNQVKSLDNAIFRRDLSEVLVDHTYKELSKEKITKTIVCIGDVHFPFHHQPSLNRVYEIIIQVKPDVVIQMGDLYDQYSHSKFPRSQNIYMPEQEESIARSQAEEMWATIRKLAPKAQCYQILGNHDLRIMKQTLATMPSIEHAIKHYLVKLMTFDGVTTIHDYRDELIIDGIMFHHGYRSRLGEHRDYVLGNMVVAHTHHGGTVFRKHKDGIIWELNCGFIGDMDAKALSYTAQKTTTQTLGVGLITPLGPQFVPF